MSRNVSVCLFVSVFHASSDVSVHQHAPCPKLHATNNVSHAMRLVYPPAKSGPDRDKTLSMLLDLLVHKTLVALVAPY
jgi:hypothetical protein